MTSTCKMIVDSLNTLGSKLTSILILDDGLPLQSKTVYCELKGQIQEILLNFTFFLPLLDCLNNWIVDKDKNLQSLVVQIQKTIEEAVERVKPEDVDNVSREICEMMKEREPQAVQDTLLLWVKRRIKTPRRALKLFDVLSQVNAKIHILKPKIEKLCCMTLLHSPDISHSEIFSCKEFGFDWLVSSSCSCLLDIEPESIGRANQLEVLELRKNLSDLQIFLHGISDILEIEDITGKVACVAVRALLLACWWWARVYQGFTARYDEVFNIAILNERKKISAGDPETLAQVLRLLKSLKAIDHSLFSKKIIEFAQYILPYFIGPVEFTREIGFSTITISTQIQMEPQELQSILTFPPHFRQLILEIENSFSCWLPEAEPLMINLLANVCLMRGEAIFIQRIRYRGRFKYPFEISGKWEFQYSKEWPEESIENVSQILEFLDEVALLQDMPDCCFPCPETVLEFSVLLKVQFFKLKRQLESNNGISKFSLKDKVQSFQDWSEFLTHCFLRYKDNTAHFNNACRKYEVGIESIVKTVVSSSNSFLNHYYVSDEMVQSVDRIFSSLLDDITSIMAGIVVEFCLPVRISNLPKTNALGFYDILLGKVHELMNCKANLVLSFKQYMEELLVHLHFFRNFVGDYLGPERKTQELRDLYVYILHVAYETEYLIESILFSAISQWQISAWLYNLLLNMRQIKMQVSEIIEKQKKIF